MAKKDNTTPKVVEDEKVVTTTAQDENTPTPESAKTNGEKDGRDVRTPQVGTPVTTSFDERTGVTQPFVLADGTQDNGLRDPSKAEGARKSATREGDQTTVEDTDTAIENGDIEGKQTPLDDVADEKPLNPEK